MSSQLRSIRRRRERRYGIPLPASPSITQALVVVPAPTVTLRQRITRWLRGFFRVSA